MKLSYLAVFVVAFVAVAALMRRLCRPAARNPYGDELKSTVSGFGSDVSSQRSTPFEEDILNRAAQLQRSSKERLCALDLFSGYCAANAHNLANLGFIAYAVDFSPPDAQVVSLLGRRLPGGGMLHYVQLDVRKLDLSTLHGQFSLVTCQRGLHFLRFQEAKEMIAMLAPRMKSGASMFFSIGAVDCKVGDGYKHSHLPVSERWHPLEPELGAPIHVTEPLCLYKEEDVYALFDGLGGQVVSVGRDDFGLFVVEYKCA
jgi:hypothetical protein